MQESNVWSYFRLLLMACLIAASNPATASEQDEQALETLKQYIQDFTTYSANFVQNLYGQSGELLESSGGIVRLEKPGKFNWAYKEPYSQFLISNGDVIWIYDQDLEQVTISEIDTSIRNSPAAILGGDMEIEENFNVRDIGMRDRLNWIELVSNQEDVEFNAIRLGFMDGELAGMVLFDNLGQITELVFSDISRNKSIDEGLFRFEPPEGVDVIDSREQQ